MKGKFTAVLFILLFILIAGVVFTVLASLDNNAGFNLFGVLSTPEVVASEPTPQTAPVTTPFAVPNATPVPTPVVTPAATPAPTLAPVPTLPPQPTTVPTTAPTTVPTTVPVPTTLSSGSFRSDTGTGLNIVADWSVQSLNQNQVTVTVSVSAISFALHTQTLPNAVNIGLNGQYVSLEAPAINYDGGEQMITSLASRSFTVDLPSNSSTTLALQVEWQFNGVYGGTELPVIECGGSISIAR